MRVRAPGLTVKDVWDALTAGYGVVGSYAKLLEDNLDAKVSLAKADVSALETRLSAARGGFLDNLDNASLLDVPDLSTLSAARIGYLDNIDASLKELFYEQFATTVDDYSDAVVSGTATNPDNLLDNDVGSICQHTGVNQYVEIAFGGAVYVKRWRQYGNAGMHANTRFKIEAYVDGAWADCETGIVGRQTADWSTWADLTTPRTAARWRFTCTTYGDPSPTGELELKGVGLGV